VFRFFAPAADATGTIVALPDDEATHLTRVLRLTTGDTVRVFDGRGREWLATVNELGKDRATVQLGELVPPRPEPSIAITLAIAVLKGDKMDDVVRDAVMLGVVAIAPMVTDRTEISAAAIERSGRVARWQRIAVSSAKQSGRAIVPAVSAAQTFTDIISSKVAAAHVMLVEPSTPEPSIALQQLPKSPAVHLIVGPEGGWSPNELTLAASAGAVMVTLGTQTLRAEAVPLVAMSALRAIWNDL
jgi:16S rRNA (uracil1498-N3)-methyltransferase